MVIFIRSVEGRTCHYLTNATNKNKAQRLNVSCGNDDDDDDDDDDGGENDDNNNTNNSINCNMRYLYSILNNQSGQILYFKGTYGHSNQSIF